MNKKAIFSCTCVTLSLLAGCATNPPLPKPASSDVSASSGETTSAPIHDYKDETKH